MPESRMQDLYGGPEVSSAALASGTSATPAVETRVTFQRGAVERLTIV